MDPKEDKQWQWLSSIFEEYSSKWLVPLSHCMNSMKLVIPLHFISLKKDSKRCCDTTTPESTHIKDESKRNSTFAFIFGEN